MYCRTLLMVSSGRVWHPDSFLNINLNIKLRPTTLRMGEAQVASAKCPSSSASCWVYRKLQKQIAGVICPSGDLHPPQQHESLPFAPPPAPLLSSPPGPHGTRHPP